jgi:hypothetical protein
MVGVVERKNLKRKGGPKLVRRNGVSYTVSPDARMPSLHGFLTSGESFNLKGIWKSLSRVEDVVLVGVGAAHC